jgi:molecular chaperone GrpE
MSKKKDKEVKTENKTEEVCHDDVASVESDHPSDQALIVELEDKLLRSRAEIENLSRRHLVDLEKAHKYGVENLLSELLPVIDNLEHAINNFGDDSRSEDREGIELTLKSFESALDKFNMIPINPLGEEFNPEMHEAVSIQPDKDLEDNQISNVLQRGWQVHERVVRPARVIVVKN